MKRQKRDMTDRAYQKGYQAGFSGRNKDACPHHQQNLRQQWLSGWREGRTDNWSGYSDIAALQKQILH